MGATEHRGRGVCEHGVGVSIWLALSRACNYHGSEI